MKEIMKNKPLHKRKRLKTWDQISEEQRVEVLATRPKTFTATKGVVAYAPESNSEIGVIISDEGVCLIKMWRKIGKDVFVHDQTISIHGARALMTSLTAAIDHYDSKKAKAD